MKVGEATNDKDLVQALNELRQTRLNNRRPYEVNWWNNIATVAGDHYSEYVLNQGTFMEPKKEQHEVRLVINQARVVARQELAKVTKSRPVMEVIPRSSDEVDIAAAKVGGFALDAAEWKFKLRRKRRQALWWTLQTGVAAIYVGYDPANDKDGLVEFILDPLTKEPVTDQVRLSELKELEAKGEIDDLPRESWPLGDLEYRVYSPFQLLPDDTVLDWEDISDIIVVDLVELEQAKDIWPEAARRIQPEGSRQGSVFERIIRRAGLDAQQTASQDVVNVYSYWLKPGVYSGKYLSEGKMVRWCNADVALEVHPQIPFSDRQLPFAFFTHTPNAVSIWPDCTITDVRPINLELDKTISQLLENRDYMVNPMWRVAEQSQTRKIKSSPGGLLKYIHVRDVPPPEQLPGVPMPTQMENLVVGLRDMILDVSGMGEVSRGRVPSGVRAGNMLAFLQEEDETKIGVVVEQFEDAVAQMASMTLSRFSQFYSVSRILRNYRPGGRSDVRKFKGADLKGNTDVLVQAGSALPKLKSAKQQYVLQLAQLGIETDPKRIKDWLELGEGEPDEIDLAFAQADRENDLMLRAVRGRLDPGEESLFQQSPEGSPGGNGEAQLAMLDQGPQPSSFAIPVKSWHIHEAHIARHRREMMSPEFEALALTYPDVVRIFDEHVAMHEQALQQQQMQQMQMMLLARGGPEATTPPPEAQPMAAAGEVAQRGGGT